jgi:hypothetical protein
MVEINFDTTDLENKLKLTITTIEQSANLEGLFASTKLPILIGQTAQRTIDNQDYADFTEPYKSIRFRKFGNRPFERLTDRLYNTLKVGQGFDFSLTGSKDLINVTITDPVARGQQRLKRFIFLPDQELADDLAQELNTQLTIKLSSLFR